MDWLNKLQNIDRRIIYVILILSVIVPLMKPLGLPIPPSDKSQSFFDIIDDLNEGDKILFSCDYNPSGAPELQPMNEAVLRHCFTKGIKVFYIGLWDQGPNLASNAIDKVKKDFPNKKYGVDYINLGYKAGGFAVVQRLGSSEFIEVCKTEINGADLTDNKKFPIMKGIKNLSSFNLVLGLTGGNNGIKDAWLPVAQAQYGMTVCCGCTSVSAPEFYQYCQTGQIAGLLEGIKGAAEYEQLLDKKGIKNAIGKGCSSIDVQSVIHLFIMFMIIIANAIYFIDRKKKGVA